MTALRTIALVIGAALAVAGHHALAAAAPSAQRACLRACARAAARCSAFDRQRRAEATRECAAVSPAERSACVSSARRNTALRRHRRYLRRECRPCCLADPQRCAVANGHDEFWTVVPPAEAGMRSAVLDGARCYAFTGGRHTQGVVIARGARIVAEWYAPGRDARSLATSFSVAKSVSATLVGILLDRGAIPDLDVPLGGYFPEWAGTPRASMTLRNLLAMRSGLAPDAPDALARLFLSPDQLTLAITQPLQAVPGTQFAYSSHASMLLARIIERASGDTVARFARAALFEPIGMNAAWWTDQSGRALTYCCIDATARDFARFGLLMARGGAWDGRQVVSRTWVERATASIPENDGIYALHWWTDLQDLTVGGQRVPSFSALGYDMQRIDVFPTLDLVIVRTGEYDYTGDSQRIAGAADYPRTRPPEWWDAREFAQRVLRSVVR